MNPVLKVHRVCKSYEQGSHRVEVLEHLSMEAEPGEKIAILGPSGCGKSTLLSLLAGLDKPDVGTVEIDGVDLARMSEDERSRTRSEKLGIVFQQYHLMRNLTAIENVGLPWKSSINRTMRTVQELPSKKWGFPTGWPIFPRKCPVVNASAWQLPVPW